MKSSALVVMLNLPAWFWVWLPAASNWPFCSNPVAGGAVLRAWFPLPPRTRPGCRCNLALELPGRLTQGREEVMAVSRPGRARVATWLVIGVLLTAALAGTLWVPFYNQLTPAFGGFPFFYWYQLMWVPIIAILSGISYLLSRLAQPDNAPPEPTASGAQAPDPSTGRDDVA